MLMPSRFGGWREPPKAGSRLDRRDEAGRIINQLIRAGWNGEQIGAALDVSRTTISRWRNGTRAPNPVRLRRLRNLLGEQPR
jgi:hypothetical protein